MLIMNDWKVLQEYIENGSEEAFGKIVSRYINAVFSTCLREVNDRQIAEDAVVTVFLLLARKANTFKPDIVLSGWLFNTARFVSRNAIRDERRRRNREQKVVDYLNIKNTDTDWDTVNPLLNDAFTALNENDRNAVLLRFYEDLSLAEVGVQLGISENTARMRLSRAIDKMRKFYHQNGVSISSLTLSALIASKVVEAAPPHLFSTTVTTVATGSIYSVTVSNLVQGAIKQMLVTKIKWAVAIFAACLLSTGIVGGMAKNHISLYPQKTITSKSNTAGRRYAFYYFKDVIDMAHPNNPIQMTIDRGVNGYEQYTFTDKRTNQSFRDGAAIIHNLSLIIANKNNKRPNTVFFRLPKDLFSDIPSGCYLSTMKAKQANALITEMKSWKAFLAACPLVMDSSDILPSSTAKQRLQSIPAYRGRPAQQTIVYSVSQSFTSDGARKMEAFTSSHIDAIMGIVLDGRVLSAPTIRGVITNNGEISGGFKNLPAAQAMADRMNKIASDARK